MIMWFRIGTKIKKKKTEAQLFEDRLVLTQGLDFNLGFFFPFYQKHFVELFSVIFLKHPIAKL